MSNRYWVPGRKLDLLSSTGGLIKCDSDGSNLIAVYTSSTIKLSTDFGETFNTTPVSPGSTSCLASNADGSVLLVGGGTYGRLWITVNSGESWTETRPDGDNARDWGTIACSAIGDIIYASNNYSGGSWTRNVWKTINYGVSWTNISPAADKNWPCLSCSDLGDVVVAGSYSGFLYVSTNYGETWTQVLPELGSRGWWASSVSGDGNTIITGYEGGPVYISYNSGADWVSKTLPGTIYRTFASNYDGTTLVIGFDNYGGNTVHYSLNSGETWYKVFSIPTGNSWFVDVNSTGDILYLSGNVSGLYNFSTLIFEGNGNWNDPSHWSETSGGPGGSDLSIDGVIWTGAIRTIGTGKQFTDLFTAITDANAHSEDSLFLIDAGTYNINAGVLVADHKVYIRGLGNSASDVVINMYGIFNWLQISSDLFMENITFYGSETAHTGTMLDLSSSTGNIIINKCVLGTGSNTKNNVITGTGNSLSINFSKIVGSTVGAYWWLRQHINSSPDRGRVSFNKVSWTPMYGYADWVDANSNGTYALDDKFQDPRSEYGPDYGTYRITFSTLPALGNDAIFDENSFTQDGEIVTIPVNVDYYCDTLDASGVTKEFTLFGGGVGYNHSHLYVSENMLLNNKVTCLGYGWAAELTISMIGTGNLDANGATFGSEMWIYFSGDYSLSSDLIMHDGITIGSGNFNTNNYDITAGILFSIFDGGASNYNFGTSTITTMEIDISYDGIDCSLDADESTIILTPVEGEDFTYMYLGRFTWGNIIVYGEGTFVSWTDYGGIPTINNLTLYPYPHNVGYSWDVYISNYDDQPVCINNITVDIGDRLINMYVDKISKVSGTLDLNNLSIAYSQASGGATFNALRTNSCVDAGNNTGFNFGDSYKHWVGNGGNWNDANHWSQISGGPIGEPEPIQTDIVKFDEKSFFEGGGLFDFDNGDWSSSVANSYVFSAVQCYEDNDVYYSGSSSLKITRNDDHRGYIEFYIPNITSDFTLVYRFRFSQIDNYLNLIYIWDSVRNTYIDVNLDHDLLINMGGQDRENNPFTTYNGITSLSSLTWHKFELIVLGRNITLKINDIEITTITSEIDNPLLGIDYFQVYNGNTLTTDREIWIDSVSITSNSEPDSTVLLSGNHYAKSIDCSEITNNPVLYFDQSGDPPILNVYGDITFSENMSIDWDTDITWEEIIAKEFTWGIKVLNDCHLTSGGILLPPITNTIPE